MRLDGGFAAGNDDVARRIGFQTAQNIGQAHHAEFEVVGIAPAAREIAFAQADENGRACLVFQPSPCRLSKISTMRYWGLFGVI